MFEFYNFGRFESVFHHVEPKTLHLTKKIPGMADPVSTPHLDRNINPVTSLELELEFLSSIKRPILTYGTMVLMCERERDEKIGNRTQDINNNSMTPYH